MPLAYFDSFVIELSEDDVNQARISYVRGATDRFIPVLRMKDRIQKQLDSINPDDVRAELKEYGTLFGDDLTNHDDNLNAILTLALWQHSR